MSDDLTYDLIDDQPILATLPADQGFTGLSAYAVALKNGFVGTEAAWLASLQGAPGGTGPAGPVGPSPDLSTFYTKSQTDTALNLKAPTASPAFTGAPTAPTPAPGTNTTQIATSAFVKAAVDALVNAAPGQLDTLKELADAIGDDANFGATITAALASKASATDLANATASLIGTADAAHNTLGKLAAFLPPLAPLVTGPGTRAGSRIGLGHLVNSGNYDHFTRGCTLPGGRMFAIGYRGNAHGSADTEAFFTQKLVSAAGSLTLDGPAAAGGGFLTPPVKLYLRTFSNETGTNVTIFGTLASAPTVATSVVYALPNNDTLSTPEVWNSVTGASISAPSRGYISIGVQQAPSSMVGMLTVDGGENWGNEFYLVDGRTAAVQGYQGQAAYSPFSGLLYAFYFKADITAGTNGTFRRPNTNRGDPTAWGVEQAITFLEADGNPLAASFGRPIFFSPIQVRADGSFRALVTSGRWVFQAVSTNEGLTWTCTSFTTMAKLVTDQPVITDIGANLFKISGNYTGFFLSGVKFLNYASALGNNGVFTVASGGSTYDSASNKTTINTVETVAGTGADGRMCLSGIVGINVGTNTITIPGNHIGEAAVGECTAANGTPGGDLVGDGLYTIAVIALNTDGKNTDYTMVETLRSTTPGVGRLQNAELGEAGVAWADDTTGAAILRASYAGTTGGEFYSTRNGGATAWKYGGRVNAKSTAPGGFVSFFLSLVRTPRGPIGKLYYHRRNGVGADPWSLCYRTFDFFAALDSALVFGPERVIVSNTTGLLMDDGSTVYAPSANHRHGYPCVFSNDTGDVDVVLFSLEQTVNTANRYCVQVRPDLSAYFGGQELIASVSFSSYVGGSYTLPDIIRGYSRIEVRGAIAGSVSAQFAIRESNDQNTFQQTGQYATGGSTGTASSFFPLQNVASAAGIVVNIKAILDDVGDPTRPTTCCSSGAGVATGSTTGAVVMSRRTAAAAASMLQVVSSDASSVWTGKLEFWGTKNPLN